MYIHIILDISIYGTKIIYNKMNIILTLDPCLQMSCELLILVFQCRTEIVKSNRKEEYKAKESTKQYDQRCLGD